MAISFFHFSTIFSISVREFVKNILPIFRNYVIHFRKYNYKILIIFRNGEQMKKLEKEVKTIIMDAAKRLTGVKRRAYQAKIALDYFEGSARKAEREMGWGRESVEKGLKETKSGIRCIDNYQGRGRKRTEDKLSNLREDIKSLAEPQTQADPAMKSSLTYTRITAKAMRKTLIDEKGYNDEDLPTERNIGNILDRLGYNLKQFRSPNR
jgi:hypothetical protein